MMQRGKHVMSRKKFISVLFRQQQCGLSIADFCENEGYSRSRFYLWKQKYGITEWELLAEASRLGVKENFVPIVINGDTPSPSISHEALLTSPQPTVKVCRNVRCPFFFCSSYKNRFIFFKQRYIEDFFDLCVPNI